MSSKSTKNNFLSSEEVKSTVVAEAAAPVKVKNPRGRKRIRGEMKRMSFSLSKTLYNEFKDFSLEHGMSIQDILHSELEEYLNAEEKPTLKVRYKKDPEGNVARGVDLDVDLKVRLEEYAQESKLSKRFILEGLISKYLDEML